MTDERRLRVYWLPNWDGTHSALVAARNQKEACRLMLCTVGEFRRYGGRRVDDDYRGLRVIALSEPGRVWKQKIPLGPPEVQPWVYA